MWAGRLRQEGENGIAVLGPDKAHSGSQEARSKERAKEIQRSNQELMRYQ